MSVDYPSIIAVTRRADVVRLLALQLRILRWKLNSVYNNINVIYLHPYCYALCVCRKITRIRDNFGTRVNLLCTGGTLCGSGKFKYH